MVWNEGDKMKKKFSQDSVIVEEVIEDMNSNLDKFVENLKHSQVTLEMPSGMEDLPTWMEDSDDTISDIEGEESDLQRFFEYDDASISGLSSNFPTSVLDDDVSINVMKGDWILDLYHNVDDYDEDHIQDLFYELDLAYKDVVEHVTDPLVYEDVGDKDVCFVFYML
uniref:Uncharacterized protein n=1 Tax=Tanacetum cinerariifolium TaxID=118510 RepID=A0A6L2J8P4_TANCI|nr:hypothetical protein [Tanacetum cinerariifolium]